MSINIINKDAVKATVHGVHKSKIMSRIADGCGSAMKGFLTAPAGMPEDNPFKSKKQQAYLAINKPEIAKKFAMHRNRNRGMK